MAGRPVFYCLRAAFSRRESTVEADVPEISKGICRQGFRFDRDEQEQLYRADDGPGAGSPGRRNSG